LAALKTQVLENASTEKASTKQRISPALENACTENASTNEQGWKTQVRKTQVRICNGGKRKCRNRKSILKSLRFSSLAFSVDPLSEGLAFSTPAHSYWRFPYLRFPPLHIRTYVFRTCIFHPPVLSLSALAFSVASRGYDAIRDAILTCARKPT